VGERELRECPSFINIPCPGGRGLRAGGPLIFRLRNATSVTRRFNKKKDLRFQGFRFILER
jgi:hypothetical protein